MVFNGPVMIPVLIYLIIVTLREYAIAIGQFVSIAVHISQWYCSVPDLECSSVG